MFILFHYILFQTRTPPGQSVHDQPPEYDCEHEKNRKEQLIKLFSRTPEQVIMLDIRLNMSIYLLVQKIIIYALICQEMSESSKKFRLFQKCWLCRKKAVIVGFIRIKVGNSWKVPKNVRMSEIRFGNLDFKNFLIV